LKEKMEEKGVRRKGRKNNKEKTIPVTGRGDL
jgi:hypothetical protein